jgi:hypothetical protein
MTPGIHLSWLSDLCVGENASIQNNCEFRLFCSRHQAHAFSKPNPRKPAFPYIDPANCKTFSGRSVLTAYSTSRDRLAWLKTGTPPNRYGHLFPRGDDGAELAAAEQALLA